MRFAPLDIAHGTQQCLNLLTFTGTNYNLPSTPTQPTKAIIIITIVGMNDSTFELKM